MTATECCGVDAYRDRVDAGVYCSICDAEVDPQTGRRLTEREQEKAWAKREEGRDRCRTTPNS